MNISSFVNQITQTITDELEVPIDDDIPEIELEEIDKELGGDSNLGSDDMDDMDEENKEEDGEN